MFPSKSVKVNPAKLSEYVCFKSFNISIATCSPSSRLSVASDLQWTDPMLRPIPTLFASLFNSPPTVRGTEGERGITVWPLSPGFGIKGSGMI